MTTDVIIVGAGPTGLMAANQLVRFGINFVIIDSKSSPTVESRAITITARSLEIYQQMGLSDFAILNGAKINSFNVYFDGSKKAEIKIGEIGRGFSDFHYLLSFEQCKNEELLYKNLISHGKDVKWNTEFIKLTERSDNVEVITNYNGKEYTYYSKYVIACDGAKSPIRHQIGFSFDGGTYENKFYVADALLEWSLPTGNLIISPGDQNFCGFFPMAGRSNYRILGSLPKKFYYQENIQHSDVEAVVKDSIKQNIKFHSINWLSIYKLHHRCVDVFRKGRIFLAGDSAHIHSPAGGQGMNTGLQDAYNLCWKLSYVLKGYAKSELLDTYNQERLPFAKWLMKFTDKAFQLMTSDNWFLIKIRRHFTINMMKILMSRNFIGTIAFNIVSQLKYSYNKKSFLSLNLSRQYLKFKAGQRLPFIENNFYLKFKHAGFSLLHINDTHFKKENPFQKYFKEEIPIIESNIHLWKKWGVNKELFILVRPDNYIALISDEYETDSIDDYFKKILIPC